MITLFNIRPRGLNIGNDVIARAMRMFIDNAFGEIVNVISLPATAKYEAHTKAGLSAQSIYEINQFGDGVIVGGGNLYENGELQVDLNALKALEPPMMIFSVSAGRVYGRQDRLVRRTNAMPDNVVQAINARADISLARDHATLNYLHSLGIEKAKLGGCPTAFLHEAVEDLPNISPQNENLVLVSVRNPQLMSIPLPAQARVHNDVATILKRLQAKKMGRVVLVCHDYRDIAFAASFAPFEYIYLEDEGAYLRMIQSCRLLVSYRLHATLPALSYNVPVISISYDERAISALDTFGMGAWDIDMIKTPDVIGELERRLANMAMLDEIKQGAAESLQGLRTTMHDNFRYFAKLVRGFKTSVAQSAERGLTTEWEDVTGPLNNSLKERKIAYGS